MSNIDKDTDQILKLAHKGMGRRSIYSELKGKVTEHKIRTVLKDMRDNNPEIKIPVNQQEKSRRTVVDTVKELLESGNYDTYDLAKRFNQRPSAAMTTIKKANGEYAPTLEWVKNNAFKGIKLSLLKKDLNVKDIKRAEEILKENFPNHFISKIRLDDGDIVLTPIYDSKNDIDSLSVDSQEKQFKYSLSVDNNYMSVRFDDSLPGDGIKIYNFSDIHIGSKAHRAGLFKTMVDIVKNDPCAFVVLGGDMMEVATRNSATHPNEQFLNINEQVSETVRILTPIAEKILCYLDGNHEFRVEKFSDFSLGRVTAQLLKVPFFKSRSIIDYEFRGISKTHSHTHYYSKGALRENQIVDKVREVIAKTSFPIHWFTSGHTHEFFHRKLYTQYKITGTGIYNQECHVLNSGSTTADTGTYTELWDLKPTAKDFTWIWFKDNGEYGCGHEEIKPI